MKKEARRQLNVRVSEGLAQTIKERARQEDRTVTSIVRRAVTQYVEQPETVGR